MPDYREKEKTQTPFRIQKETGTSLVLQWLRLGAPNVGGLGSIPGQGTRSHMLQLDPAQPKNKCLLF